MIRQVYNHQILQVLIFLISRMDNKRACISSVIDISRIFHQLSTLKKNTFRYVMTSQSGLKKMLRERTLRIEKYFLMPVTKAQSKWETQLDHFKRIWRMPLLSKKRLNNIMSQLPKCRNN
jgi:hypothetical protein